MTAVATASRTAPALWPLGRTTGRGGVLVRHCYETTCSTHEGVVVTIPGIGFFHLEEGAVHFEAVQGTGERAQFLPPRWWVQGFRRASAFEFEPFTAWVTTRHSGDLISLAPVEDLDEVDYAIMEAAIVGPTRTDPSQALLTRLEEARADADIDEEETDAAERALNDAWAFAKRPLPGRLPRVHVSEEGVVTFHWRGTGCGVLLVFVGDGKVTCSVKLQDGLYAVGSTSIGIGDALPEALESAIQAVGYDTGF